MKLINFKGNLAIWLFYWFVQRQSLVQADLGTTSFPGTSLFVFSIKKERTLGKRLVGIETNLHFTLTGDVIQQFPLSLFDKTGCTILVIIKLLFFLTTAHRSGETVSLWSST